MIRSDFSDFCYTFSMTVSSRITAFKLYPYKKNQDVVYTGTYITRKKKEIDFASIVDGWNNPEKISSNEPGRVVAKLVSEKFPALFLQHFESENYNFKQLNKISDNTAQEIEKEVLSLYPEHASCVASFIVSFADKNIVITISTISTLIWIKNHWEKPKEIGDYRLDPKKYPSGASHMIGRGELKNDSLYLVKTDALIVPKNTPIFISTDGLLMQGGIMNLAELNRYSQETSPFNPDKFITGLGQIIEKKRAAQKDDISVFIQVG